MPGPVAKDTNTTDLASPDVGKLSTGMQAAIVEATEQNQARENSGNKVPRHVFMAPEAPKFKFVIPANYEWGDHREHTTGSRKKVMEFVNGVLYVDDDEDAAYMLWAIKGDAATSRLIKYTDVKEASKLAAMQRKRLFGENAGHKGAVTGDAIRKARSNMFDQRDAKLNKLRANPGMADEFGSEKLRDDLDADDPNNLILTDKVTNPDAAAVRDPTGFIPDKKSAPRIEEEQPIASIKTLSTAQNLMGGEDAREVSAKPTGQSGGNEPVTTANVKPPVGAGSMTGMPPNPVAPEQPTKAQLQGTAKPVVPAAEKPLVRPLITPSSKK